MKKIGKSTRIKISKLRLTGTAAMAAAGILAFSLSPVSAEPETAGEQIYGLCDSMGYATEAVRIRAEPDTGSEMLSLLAPGGIVWISDFVEGADGKAWARAWFEKEGNGLQTHLEINEYMDVGYISAAYLITGINALDQAVSSGYLYAYSQEEIPLYFDATGTGTIDLMYPWDILNVLDREGTRVEVSTYDGTSAFVDIAQVSFRTDQERKTAEKEGRFYPVGYSAQSGSNSERQALTNAILSTAMKHLGGPYIHGGESWETGVDCSSFVQKVFAESGISLPRVSVDQYSACIPIAREAILPGDIVFYHGYYNGVPTPGIGHVAIYLGDGQVIHSRNAQRGICTDPIDTLPIIAVGRCY